MGVPYPSVLLGLLPQSVNNLFLLLECQNCVVHLSWVHQLGSVDTSPNLTDKFSAEPPRQVTLLAGNVQGLAVYKYRFERMHASASRDFCR